MSPDDVGLSYSSTLSTAALATFFWLLSTAVVAAVFGGSAALWHRVGTHLNPEARFFSRFTRRQLLAAVVIAMATMFPVVTVIWTARAAERLAVAVKDGWTISPGSGSQPFVTTSWQDLGLRAEPVWAFWTDDRTLFVADGGPLTYLGSNGDVVFLYHVELRDTLAIPHGQVVIGRTDEHRGRCSGGELQPLVNGRCP